MTTSQAEPAIYRPVTDPNLTLRRSALMSEIVQYVLVGAVFAVLLIKAEVVSWYRIQEIFRFQSFHMYGVLIGSGGSVVAVVGAAALLGTWTYGFLRPRLPH